MKLNRKTLVLLGLVAIMLAGSGVAVGYYLSSNENPVPESVAEIEISTSEAAIPADADASQPVSDSSKDAAPDFVCDKGISDLHPDISASFTREAVAQAITARHKLFLNAPISCIRVYFNAIADTDEKAHMSALSDDELLELAQSMAVFFDKPDRARMFSPNTEWDMRDSSSLVITEIINGSSSGHWNARYKNGMWW